MSVPTDEQIKIATTNLTNMIFLNRDIFPRGTAKILNAFLKFETTDSDPGLNIVLNILEGGFWAVASLGGPVSSFAASFLSGMLSYWVTDTPPSLKGQFGSYLERFDRTSEQVTIQLGKFKDGLDSKDPKIIEKVWNTRFTYNGKTASVADLGNSYFPSPGSTDYDRMIIKAAFALDQELWKQILKANYYVHILSGNVNTGYKDKNVPPIPFILEQIKYYPASYWTWYWFPDECPRWIAKSYIIKTGYYPTYGYWLNDACCRYLFKDSLPGHTINEYGLFTRQEVVDFIGMKYEPDVTTLSESYRKAAKRGKTLERLVARQGREAIEARVFQKAREDAFFARDLTFRPKETLEKFLDIKIPDHISLTVVVEDEMHYGLVIPAAKESEEPAVKELKE